MIELVFHIFAALIWVGGMFFAYMFLRPVAVEMFQPSERLKLWRAVFQRFFPWVWFAVLTLPTTGYLMLFGQYVTFDQAPATIKSMAGLGAVMGLLFAIVFFFPYRWMKKQIDAEDFPAAGKSLAYIRRIIGINLILGLCVVIVAGMSP